MANYVDNNEFRELIRSYREQKLQAEAEGKEPPRIPEKAGYYLMQIAERYAHRHNFRNYPYRDDMVLDAIASCVRAFGNFDPDRGTSPLSYFTQCVHYSFIGTISKEKKMLYTKVQMIKEGAQEFYDSVEGDEDFDSGQKQFLMDFLDRNDAGITFGFMEKKPTEPKPVVKKEYNSPLDNFFGDDENGTE